MIIDENIKVIRLIDIYGDLLTDKQRTIMTSYYFDNLTLSEIAECHNISRQAVRDSISQSNRLLNDYEDKLGFVQKLYNLKKCLIDLREEVTKENLTDKIDKCLDLIDN